MNHHVNRGNDGFWHFITKDYSEHLMTEIINYGHSEMPLGIDDNSDYSLFAKTNLIKIILTFAIVHQERNTVLSLPGDKAIVSLK